MKRKQLHKAANPFPVAATLFDRGLQYHRLGQLAEAEKCYREVLAGDARHAGALHLLGVIALQLGQNGAAIDYISQAIAIDGTMAIYHSNLGNALKGLGRLYDAVIAYGMAIRLNAEYAEAYSNLGTTLTEQLRLAEADDACRSSLCFKPDFSEAHFNLGNALWQQRRYDQVVPVFIRAIRCQPDHAEAWSNLGNALEVMGRLTASAAAYTSALCRRPDFAEAYFNLGNVLREGLHSAKAANAYDKAIRCKPDFVEAKSNLGNAFNDMERLNDAVRAHKTALCFRPAYPEGLSSIGNALNRLGHLDDGIKAYDMAIRCDPDYAEAHFNQGVALLLAGDLSRGWAKFEWRWRGGCKAVKPRSLNRPQWQGESLDGRTILLHAEQGLGDTIQFCRYASQVSAGGGRVILQAPRRLLRLLAGLAGVDRLVPADASPPEHHFHCPLMSLPAVFGTTQASIPGSPYLQAEPSLIEKWHRRIGSHGFKIGIVWQGDPNGPAERGRSFPLGSVASLSKVAGVRLISLQKLHGLDQLARLPASMPVETLGENFDSGPDAFVDTAAVLMALDLVITADTAVGHLAGALGRPVWIALQAFPHWVWMLERDDSPWYHSARLFRQDRRGDWVSVFERMRTALVDGCGINDACAGIIDKHR